MFDSFFIIYTNDIETHEVKNYLKLYLETTLN